MLDLNIHQVHNLRMSKLHAYISDNGIRQADFAARVGTTQATISKLVRGAVLPSLELAVRIERETGGAVPATSWVPMTEKDVA